MLIRDIIDSYDEEDTTPRIAEMCDIFLEAPEPNGNIVDFFCDEFIPANLENILTGFSPECLEFIYNNLDKQIEYNKDTFIYLNKLEFCFLAYVCEDEVFLASDFIDLFKKIYTEDFKIKHKIRSFVTAADLFCKYYYGTYTKADLIKVLNVMPLINTKYGKECVAELLDGKPNILFNSSAFDPEELLNAHSQIKDYYIPTYNEVMENLTKTYISTPELKEFNIFLSDVMGIDFEDIYYINHTMQKYCYDDPEFIISEIDAAVDIDEDYLDDFYNHFDNALDSLHNPYYKGHAKQEFINLNDFINDILD